MKNSRRPTGKPGARRGRARLKATNRKASTLTFETLEPRLAMTGVVINEFLAGNENGITDQDGQRNDWIELKNTDPAPVDITGWRLTDEAGNLTKWTFPATTIAANSYLRIFASDKNRAVSGQELHTNFKLAKEAGEYLALVDADGMTVVHSYSAIPAQLDDVSYGVGTNPGTTATETFVGASSQLRVHVPAAESTVVAGVALDDAWRELGYDDSNASLWLPRTGRVGYDRNGVSGGTFPLTAGVDRFELAEMPDARSSAYVRTTFNLQDKDQLTSLALTVKFDDGFIAFLNGREVHQVNFGDDFSFPQPAWNSRAGNQTGSSTMVAANRGNEAIDTAITFDLTPYLPTLLNGSNVLAFHLVTGVSGGVSNGDLLLEPVLTATRTSGTQTGFMAGPTPGDDNGVSSLGYVGDTHFSVDRGFFSAAFPVTITADRPTASIRYTTDGSAPTPTNGTLYTGPVNITTTTVLRAIAYETGYTSSNADTETYIFLADVVGQDASDALAGGGTWGYAGPDWAMDPDVVNNPLYSGATMINALKAIPTVSLVMNSFDLFGTAQTPGTTGNVAPQGMYLTGKGKERAASFEYFNALNAADQVHADTAIEIQGHSSTLRWRTDKLSFQVKFKYPYGDTELNYPLFAGTPDGDNATSEFDTVILDAISNYGWTHQNAGQNINARFVTDQVAADLQNMASGGGDAPHGKYVHLYLNGLYWGMYDMHERPDDSFAAEYYGSNKDDYYVVKAATDDPKEYTYVEGGVAAEASWQQMIGTTNYATAQTILDVDQFVDYMIVHFYAGNANDWPHNNWYATRDKAVGGKWRFHEWDQEHAFPVAGHTDGATFNESTNATTYSAGEDFASPLQVHRNLMANSEEYRLRFSDRVQALMANDGPLTPQKAHDAYLARAMEIDQAIIAESARWGDNRVPSTPYTRASFITTRNGVLNNFFFSEGAPPAFQGRTATVIGQFNAVGNNWLTTLAAPLFNQYGGAITPGFDLTITKPGGSPAPAVIYYTLDGTDPRAANGGVSGTATQYMGPIDLVSTKQVKARIFYGDNLNTLNDWSAVVDKTFVTPNTFPVRITELNYHPAASEENEFIELLNTGSSQISLDGVRLTTFATNPYVFANGLTLQAGQRIVVAKNPAAFQLVYGMGINLAPDGYGTANLSNGGETIVLVGPANEELQRIPYLDQAPWPTTPDGDGYSLEIIDPLGSPSTPSNWRASFYLGGSPGTDGLPPVNNHGDFNDDNDVDGDDILLWQRGLGITAPNATRLDGDADGDKDVDADDLAEWRDHYGEPLQLAAAIAADEDEDASGGSGGNSTSALVAAATGVLQTDEWILDVPGSGKAAALGTVLVPRERPIDEAFAAWSDRRGYRPPAATDSGERTERRGLQQAAGDSAESTLECELDEILAAALAGDE